MLRQIVTPTEPRVMLELPEDYLNQEVEILAFRTGEAADLRESKGNLLNHAGTLAESPNFNGDVLAWQKAQRDEWR